MSLSSFAAEVEKLVADAEAKISALEAEAKAQFPKVEELVKAVEALLAKLKA